MTPGQEEPASQSVWWGSHLFTETPATHQTLKKQVFFIFPPKEFTVWQTSCTSGFFKKTTFPWNQFDSLHATQHWRLVSPAARQPLSPFLLEALPSWNRLGGLWMKWEPVCYTVLHLMTSLKKKVNKTKFCCLHFCSWIFVFCHFSSLDINAGGWFVGKPRGSWSHSHSRSFVHRAQCLCRSIPAAGAKSIFCCSIIRRTSCVSSWHCLSAPCRTVK